MVIITAPVSGSKAVPHTTAVSAVAVLRGEGADAMFPIKVVVPWEHLKSVAHVTVRVRAPRGFSGEVMTVEPAIVLCERSIVEDERLDHSAEPLAAGVEVVVRSHGEPFPCGVKFTDGEGAAGAVVGKSGEPLVFRAYSRLYRRCSVSSRPA